MVIVCNPRIALGSAVFIMIVEKEPICMHVPFHKVRINSFACISKVAIGNERRD